MNILIVTNIPTPYRIPLFNLLNKKLEERGCSFHVAFAAKGYERRKWEVDESEFNFSHSYLKSKKIKLGSVEKMLFTYGGILKTLKEFRPYKIIVVGFSIATLKLYFLSLIKKISYIIWTGSTPTEGYNSSIFREYFRKLLARRAEGFIAYGSRAKKYLISLGIPPDKIEIAINTVDTDYFINADRNTKSVSGGSKNILYVGYITKRKRLDLIINALKILSDKGIDFRFDVVGDGDSKNEITELVQRFKLNNKIIFHGYKQKSELPEYYSKADIFLFPSEYDIWGLVLIEAMASGLCCLSSIHAGATDDLIIDGETGNKIDFENTDNVVQILSYLISNPALCKRIGENARRFIMANASLEKSVEGFIRAINR
ncbi:MAG: glycosyltransferase family 4 protein [Ignavibacteriaceae bacterium]|nr:glycosyltransferase family 4 protein [Ignavibacteriaceae bacterium]